MATLKNATIGPILRNLLRARLDAAYANELPETIEHTTDLLLPHVSLDAWGELRFDSGAASIAPRLVATEIKGTDDNAKLRRAVSQTAQLASLLPAPVAGDTRAALAALPALSPSAGDDAKMLRAQEITMILERAYGSEDHASGY